MARRIKAVAAAAATAVLAGCGVHPGAAAVVGSQTISADRVDEVAQALCTANLRAAEANGQPPPTLPTRGAREVALEILLETELSEQFAAARGVDASPAEVSRAMAQNETGIALLPADQQEQFREVLRGYAETQLELIEIGRRSLGRDVPENEAISEGTRLREQFVKKVDVEVDPRFGTFEDGVFQRGGQSLSVPVSDRAVDGEKAQPGSSYVASLPPSQLCS